MNNTGVDYNKEIESLSRLSCKTIHIYFRAIKTCQESISDMLNSGEFEHIEHALRAALKDLTFQESQLEKAHNKKHAEGNEMSLVEELMYALDYTLTHNPAEDLVDDAKRDDSPEAFDDFINELFSGNDKGAQR